MLELILFLTPPLSGLFLFVVSGVTWFLYDGRRKWFGMAFVTSIPLILVGGYAVFIAGMSLGITEPGTPISEAPGFFILVTVLLLSWGLLLLSGGSFFIGLLPRSESPSFGDESRDKEESASNDSRDSGSFFCLPVSNPSLSNHP